MASARYPLYPALKKIFKIFKKVFLFLRILLFLKTTAKSRKQIRNI